MNSLDPERMKIALSDEAILDTRLGAVRLEHVDCGSLWLPSGQIAACDGFICIDVPAFERTVPAGRYPVLLTVAHFDSGSRYFALATVRFSAASPTRWENALCPGQVFDKLKPDQFFGYPVDSGVGCFASPDALAMMAAEQSGDALFERITNQMRQNAANAPEWANVELRDGAANLVLFSAGVGDGIYGSHWGLDDAGAIACLTTDFGLLEPPSDEPAGQDETPWFRRWMPTFFGPGPNRDEPGR